MSIQGIQGTHARSTPLRVDAQRNLEHVLRAAREVFGELGYGAPMEDVARRARVGVGTVYRRFPSKDVLVRRIAEEETARLTEQAQTALQEEDDPWSALSRFLRTAAASGAGRLLPPRILRAGALCRPVPTHAPTVEDDPLDTSNVPPTAEEGSADGVRGETVPSSADAYGPIVYEGLEDDSIALELLTVVGQLVGHAHAAGALREDVTVGDVLLVIATPAPALPDPSQHAATSARLLDIMLEGLRSRR